MSIPYLAPRMIRRASICVVPLLVAGCFLPPSQDAEQAEAAEPSWLAGDHHVHSEYSVLWNTELDPAEPILRSHGIYPIPYNAVMAQRFGLDWMVATDHGGRGHARLGLDYAYPSLLVAREAVPELIQFYGVELNTPGADHSSVIIAASDQEAQQVYMIESEYDRANGYGLPPLPRELNTEERMLELLSVMQGFADKPLVIANHPSRTSRPGEYGISGPSDFRQWNDLAPEIAVGMEGAPGHQAAGLIPEGFSKNALPRGTYPRSVPTLGGFDPMAARLGGLWDSLLGEGRRWWITATSDSHKHWSEGGNDFWPGEYSKTYVFATREYDAILQAVRSGKVFVATGDLISELDLSVATDADQAMAGEGLIVADGDEPVVTIRVRDPAGVNANGDSPAVARIDLIIGRVNPEMMLAAGDANPTTEVLRRFDSSSWSQDGEYLTMSHTLEGLEGEHYIRVRGTNTDEAEPLADTLTEDPWADLWFYSNPIFVTVE